MPSPTPTPMIAQTTVCSSPSTQDHRPASAEGSAPAPGARRTPRWRWRTDISNRVLMMLKPTITNRMPQHEVAAPLVDENGGVERRHRLAPAHHGGVPPCRSARPAPAAGCRRSPGTATAAVVDHDADVRDVAAGAEPLARPPLRSARGSRCRRGRGCRTGRCRRRARAGRPPPCARPAPSLTSTRAEAQVERASTSPAPT